MTLQSIKKLGEFGLINRLTTGVKDGFGVITGIGDDAAVTSLTPGMQLLTSTDMLLEDLHFRLKWHDPYRLGRKSLAVNLSDIAAMGGVPRWATLSIAIPNGLPLDFLDNFCAGFLSMADEAHITLIGGDTCASKSGLVISVTIMGEQRPEYIVRRYGAQIGDDVWVTGTLGDAALGLHLLENGCEISENTEALLSRLLNPSPRIVAGCALAESKLLSSMIDISDGILADFGHIAETSGVGGVIYAESIPLSNQYLNLCRQRFNGEIDLALTGGEDYELCFTAHPDNREKITLIAKMCGIDVTTIGIVTGLKNVSVHDKNGMAMNIKSNGYNHFS